MSFWLLNSVFYLFRGDLIYILAGLIAAGAAFMLNRFLYIRWGKLIVVGLVPLIEEIVKTGAALLFGASIFYTHAVFGGIEFFWDLLLPGKGDWLPAVTGLAGHLFLGSLTQQLFFRTASPVTAVLSAAVLHLFWNLIMLLIGYRMQKQKRLT